MPTRRTFLRSATLALLPGVLPPRLAAADDPPLAPFDRLMTGFLKDHQVPGGSLAITRNGKLIYSRGFGLASVEKKTPVEPDSLFRIASVSKPLTAVAVLQLVERKKLRLDEPVLKYVALKPHLAPDAKYDPRWEKITVRHCLQHRGGWDRDKSYDPIAIPGKIAAALGTKPPVPPADVVRYMMGQPLDFDPGERFAYSNLGYLLLGRLIESASGQRYEAFVRKEVLAPLGITTTRLGRALPEDRPKAEVSYYEPKQRTGVCLYPPRAGEKVPLPDGAYNFEGFEAHGGWIASAVDLVRFAVAFDDPTRCELLTADSIRTMWERPPGMAGIDAKGKPRDAYYGCGWSVRPVRAEGLANTWHGGLIAGTSTLLVRRFDGLNWAVLFNTDRDAENKILSGLIDPLLHQAAAEVKEWPEVL